MLINIVNMLPASWRRYAKGVVAIVGFALTVVATLVTDNQAVNAVIAAATAAGVLAFPNLDSDGDGTPDWAEAEDDEADHEGLVLDFELP